MEPQQVVAQFLQLPADAQRVVADLIAYLDRREFITALKVLPAAESQEAIMLPPLEANHRPAAWPENPFVEPDFVGGWADRTDIVDSTEFVRELRRTQWGVAE